MQPKFSYSERISLLIRALQGVILFFIILLPHAAPCEKPEKPVIRFGINLRYSPMHIYERYQPLMDYLTKNTPYRFELKISPSYQDAVRDLKNGVTRFASLGDGAYVEAILFHDAIPVVRPLNSEGKPFYRSAIIVPARSPSRSIDEIRGVRIALGSRHSVSGNLTPRLMLAKRGIFLITPDSFAMLRNHFTVTKAVLKGEYGCGAVKDIFVEKFSEHGLRVLAYSDPIPSPPLVARAGTPKEIIRAVADALLRLDYANPQHRSLMKGWDSEFQYGFAPARSADYKEIFRLFRTKPYGCGAGCHQ